MADSGRINAIIARAVTVLLDDSRFGPRLSNCWLPASTWAEALAKSGHIDASLVSTDARKFNVAMSKSNFFGESMTRFDGTNQTGVFRVQHRCCCRAIGSDKLSKSRERFEVRQ